MHPILHEAMAEGWPTVNVPGFGVIEGEAGWRAAVARAKGADFAELARALPGLPYDDEEEETDDDE